MRLFVAVDLNDDSKDALMQISQTHIEGAKWVKRSRLHLTLHFIGEVSQMKAEAANHWLGRMRLLSFPMRLQGVGVFPGPDDAGNPRPARVLWAGVERGMGLLGLQLSSGKMLKERIGFKPRPQAYGPHVTLARFSTPPPMEQVQHFLEQHKDFYFPPYWIDEFVLYSSEQTPQGSLYIPQGVYPLSRPKDNDMESDRIDPLPPAPNTPNNDPSD